MDNTIIINNFGPVKYAKVDLNKKLQVYIGAQASGKSTICKVIYFCQKIRDYTIDFLSETNVFYDTHENEYRNVYFKYLTKKFMGCFGTTKHMDKFSIEYTWNKYFIKISLSEKGFVRFVFQKNLLNDISNLINEFADISRKNSNTTSDLYSIISSVKNYDYMRRELQSSIKKIFGFEYDIIYIPAGRSLIATMSETLADMSLTQLDQSMQEFIVLIKETKLKFGLKIPDMINNYTMTVKGQVNNAALDDAYKLINSVLKADYVSENDGEKIYFDKKHWVKLMYGSSGQQEVLWILMLIFIIILEKQSAFVVIEEPEAHLFPKAQREVINLISLMLNVTDSKVIITTHSPYILTSTNILLYSNKIENRKNRSNFIIKKNLRLDFGKVDAFSVGEREDYFKSLMDKETNMIETNYIDGVSEIINEDLDRLIELEYV